MMRASTSMRTGSSIWKMGISPRRTRVPNERSRAYTRSQSSRAYTRSKAAESAGAKAGEPKPDAKSADSSPDAKVAKPKREVRNKIIFTLSILGVLAALVAAYLFGIERKAQPPVFKPVSSPYESAIYANGIIESDQSSGENINIFPEVAGPIIKVLVREGQQVSAVHSRSDFTIDDSKRAETQTRSWPKPT
jgi:hypothetical protein